MVSICFYFQVHQPHRMKHYRIFDIGKNSDYFDEEKNKQILRKVSDKCYIPATKMILELLRRYPGFKVCFSFSGTVLEQLENYDKGVLELFKEVIKTGRAEILSETYYHSISSLYSKEEFLRQINEHKRKIKKIFDYTPKVFRNTELIYNNEIAKIIEQQGFKGIITEGADHILGWRSPNFVYLPIGAKKIKLLMKNYKLSDDIAFRFSSREWKEWPLKAEKFAQWVNAINGNGTNVNLFMDYETFGEHQWEDTGIFEFMKKLPEEILKHPDNNFKTPSELIEKYEPVGEIDVHHPISWADIERDISAWTGNPMQNSAINSLYEIEKKVLESEDYKIISDWKKLTTSDHFYYMCTKWFNDGDVHKYFSPYDSPYDAFMNFMNILEDIKLRLDKKEVKEA
ncbi:MAG: glycoside hydrolase family 57 protein [Candidatus Pacearchaeota archaeon]